MRATWLRVSPRRCETHPRRCRLLYIKRLRAVARRSRSASGACVDRARGEEDWRSPPQVTYYMQQIFLAVVMADAAMVVGDIERDLYCRRDPEELS